MRNITILKQTHSVQTFRNIHTALEKSQDSQTEPYSLCCCTIVKVTVDVLCCLHWTELNIHHCNQLNLTYCIALVMWVKHLALSKCLEV